jgi:hypothetical protein
MMEELEHLLVAEGFDVLMSKSLGAGGILGCLENIDRADIVYVVDPNGYVGKSVSVDIGYAYARSKPIYAMHAIDDPPIMNMISKVLSFKELIDFLG